MSTILDAAERRPLLGDAASDVDPEYAKTSFDRFRSWVRLAACCISAAAAGWHDGCIGSLIPYLQIYYGGLTDQAVSLVFVGSVTGFILASLLNVTLNTKLGLGRLFLLGALFQGAASAIIAFRPPFRIMASAYAIAGFGLSLQDAQYNTYVTRLPDAPTKLGIVHGIYGVGAMISPAVATALMHAKVEPHVFYFTSLAWCIVTIATVLVGFGMGGAIPSYSKVPLEVHSDEPNASLKTVISSRSIWAALIFIALYTGSETTEAGWIVSFLMRTRNGGTNSGYASASFYAGLTSSRILLLPLTAWLKEGRAIGIYTFIALALQGVIWATPSFIVDFIAVTAVGFVMGPIYPVTLSIITKVTPCAYHPGAISLMACLGQVGSAIFPFVVGSLAEMYGIRVLQPVLVALFAIMLLLWHLVPSVESRKEREDTTI